jgi:hypothetical protein
MSSSEMLVKTRGTAQHAPVPTVEEELARELRHDIELISFGKKPGGFFILAYFPTCYFGFLNSGEQNKRFAPNPVLSILLTSVI